MILCELRRPDTFLAVCALPQCHPLGNHPRWRWRRACVGAFALGRQVESAQRTSLAARRRKRRKVTIFSQRHPNR